MTITNLKYHLTYNPATRSWFIPKGTKGTMWKDAPASKRINYDIVTTKDGVFYEGAQYHDCRVIYNQNSVLTVMKKNENGEEYFLSIEKAKYQ